MPSPIASMNRCRTVMMTAITRNGGILEEDALQENMKMLVAGGQERQE
jgi:hypothetical protein